MSARIAVGLALVLTSAISAVVRQDVWTSAKMSPLWSRVSAALKAELEPDDPSQTPPHTAALRYKRLVRVSGGEVALALIGMRENEHQPLRAELTAAYTVELVSGRKALLGKYLLWRFIKWAHFERDSTDAVFSYQSCDECEAERFVASFTSDTKAHTWKLRQWPEGESHILIGADPEPDATSHPRCLYGVSDYTGDGHDQIVTWCRTRSAKTQKITNEVFTVYSVERSGPARQIVTGDRAKALRRQLCHQNAKASGCR